MVTVRHEERRHIIPIQSIKVACFFIEIVGDNCSLEDELGTFTFIQPGFLNINIHRKADRGTLKRDERFIIIIIDIWRAYPSRSSITHPQCLQLGLQPLDLTPVINTLILMC